MLPISIYGGYFGAGAGTLLLGVLTIATEGDYRRANVAKNLVFNGNSTIAISSASDAACFGVGLPNTQSTTIVRLIA